MTRRFSDARGFTLLELLVVVAVIGILAGFAVGVTMTVVRMTRAESGGQQLDAFLRRSREMAVARRRDIEIRFLPPNRVQSAERAIPPAGGVTVLETLTFEGGIQYRLTDGVTSDTPNRFGNATAIQIGGVEPVMFAAEGAFMDAGNNPINATLSLGVEGDPLSATAITILGATATIERWRWNGNAWTK